MQVKVAEWTTAGGGSEGSAKDENPTDDVTDELREDRTEDDLVDASRGDGAEEAVQQRNTDETEQREIELREKDGNARKSVQRRQQRRAVQFPADDGIVDIRFLHRQAENAAVPVVARLPVVEEFENGSNEQN